MPGHVQALRGRRLDLLLCLVNPYKVPHDKVMQTIELMGKEVIPEFDKEKAVTAT